MKLRRQKDTTFWQEWLRVRSESEGQAEHRPSHSFLKGSDFPTTLLTARGVSSPAGEFACLDYDRERRLGFPEVVYCEGKEPDHVADIIASLADAHGRVLGTRAGQEHARVVLRRVADAHYDDRSRTLTVRRKRVPVTGQLAVVAAGTCDLPVAEEAAVTAEMMGAEVLRFYDLGVAGIHRLLRHEERLRQMDAIVVAAGMEGALPSVIGGLAPCPIIAVPTSVGYGTGLGGLAALMSMLNTCAPGVVVVNIDNGFGAGYAAGRMLMSRHRGMREGQPAWN